MKMKKMTLVLAAASLFLTGMQSCKKEENRKPPIKENINVDLAANQSYTFSLPKNKRDDAYEISSQPAHFAINEVGKDATGNRIYKYTPSLNYHGTDQVVIANVEEDEHQGGGNCNSNPPPSHGHGHGDCNGGDEDHYIITLHFNIQNTSATDK
jgi:5'-3' exonuclease